MKPVTKRATRVADQIRMEVADILMRKVRDPRLQAVTVTEVSVTNDLRLARVYFTAGLDGVPRGQWEAATALNFSARDRLMRIIIPQAIPPIVPALGNYFVLMIKDTPVLAAITVLELLQTARQIASQSFRYLEPLTMVGMFFLALSVLAAFGIRRLERQLGARTSR